MALMMFLILPLGALNAWLPAMADSAPALHQTAAQSKVQTPRTCRSAFLPGASCAKFLDLAAQPEVDIPRSAAWLLPQARIWPVQDRPAPPKGPPRTA